MKLNNFMWIVVNGLIVVVGGMFLYNLIKETESTNKLNIDSWVDDVLSEELSKKFNKPKEVIYETLQTKTPTNPEIMELIENTIQQVNLTFTRQNYVTACVRLDVSYQDGQSVYFVIEREWDNLPETIRAEMIRNGANRTHRTWCFPWIKLS